MPPIRTQPESIFLSLSTSNVNNPQNPSATEIRRFRQLYGVPPSICSMLWRKMCHDLFYWTRSEHLLWALAFLKSYTAEAVSADAVGRTETTFRSWSWYTIGKLSNLNLSHKVNLENRFNSEQRFGCFMSIDGTDVPLEEPSPFSPRWYSYKLHRAPLIYEVGVSISGDIVWTNGPFRPGSFNDVQIFRQDLRNILLPNEKVVADDGYGDRKCVRRSHLEENEDSFKRIRTRHETVNIHLKRFRVLTTPFRSSLEKHHLCFTAVANLCQALLRYEEPLFQI